MIPLYPRSLKLVWQSALRTLLCASIGFQALTPARGAQAAGPEQLRPHHASFDYALAHWAAGGDRTQYVFLNMPEFWPHAIVSNGGSLTNLQAKARAEVASFSTVSSLGTMPLQDYVRRSPTDGVIVLHRGDIVYEDYPRMYAHDFHAVFSITKTFVATIAGILEDRDQLDASEPIEVYLPELSDSAWAGTPVVDVIDMASGMDCRENADNAYDNPQACFSRFFSAYGWPYIEAPLSDPLDFLKSIPRYVQAGQEYDYTGVNTSVLALLIERVTGRRFVDVLESEIWQRVGAESPALLAISANGYTASWGGLSLRLRDLARYGYAFTPSGMSRGLQFVSEAHLDKLQNQGRPHLFRNFLAKAERVGDYRGLDGELPRHNTYQWNMVTADGDFYKEGYGGQGLYISPRQDLVIAFFGSPDDSGMSNEMRHIARQLAKSGLFAE